MGTIFWNCILNKFIWIQMIEPEDNRNIRIDESEGDASVERSQSREEEEDGSCFDNEENEEDNYSNTDKDIERQEIDGQIQKGNVQIALQTVSPIKIRDEVHDEEQHFTSPSNASPIATKALDENDQIQSEYNYDELSHQLQKALGKIKSKETIKTQSFLDRVQYFQKKKHHQLRLRKEEKELQATRMSAKQSLTNAHSQRILAQYQPIQERSQKIIQEKRKKIERQQMEKRIKEEQEIEKQLKMKQSKRRTQSGRTKQQFFSSINSWKQQKQRKIVVMAQQQIKSEMNGVTFQPQINNHSKLMIKRTGKVPIQEREVKPKKIELDKEYTFTPKVNKPKR